MKSGKARLEEKEQDTDENQPSLGGQERVKIGLVAASEEQGKEIVVTSSQSAPPVLL